MTMFHLDDWQKQSKKMGMYLNEHATDNEFDIVNRTLDKAFDMGLASYDQIFTAKMRLSGLHYFKNSTILNLVAINSQHFSMPS